MILVGPLVFTVHVADFTVGPKLYCAMTTIVDETHHGSTRLHLDVTDAVNVVVYTTENGKALWHIFCAQDADAVRRFLRHKHQLPSSVDPINSAHYYLTPDALLMLKKQEGVEPIVIEQGIRQAVCIPAGCPHQVCFAV